ncbi:hypothetical protein DPMN_037798 [Dreissena polymorpha]|uniref:Uncharacterized protein n=1 Tax=Dreissena polymorpha TaxID=45954 RepID=A0A9D4MBL5_DREPO|nr:hypothetical protein DPMN_037798 [Dreissena polymorpha]
MSLMKIAHHSQCSEERHTSRSMRMGPKDGLDAVQDSTATVFRFGIGETDDIEVRLTEFIRSHHGQHVAHRNRPEQQHCVLLMGSYTTTSTSYWHHSFLAQHQPGEHNNFFAQTIAVTMT